MKLSVPFRITIQTIKFRANYTGSITLSPKGAVSRTYYFTALNPYGGKDAELSVYEDSNKEKVLFEGIGLPVQKRNPHTGMPVTIYDFSLEQDDHRIGLVWVITQIISEGIYQAEVSGKGRVGVAQFQHYWQQDFDPTATYIVESFLKAFGINE